MRMEIHTRIVRLSKDVTHATDIDLADDESIIGVDAERAKPFLIVFVVKPKGGENGTDARSAHPAGTSSR